jgi:hypothetical protein
MLAFHSGLRSHRLPTSGLAFQLLHELAQLPPELVFGKINWLTGFASRTNTTHIFPSISAAHHQRFLAVLGKSPAAFVLTRIEQILEAIRQPCAIVQSGMRS